MMYLQSGLRLDMNVFKFFLNTSANLQTLKVFGFGQEGMGKFSLSEAEGAVLTSLHGLNATSDHIIWQSGFATLFREATELVELTVTVSQITKVLKAFEEGKGMWPILFMHVYLSDWTLQLWPSPISKFCLWLVSLWTSVCPRFLPCFPDYST